MAAGSEVAWTRLRLLRGVIAGGAISLVVAARLTLPACVVVIAWRQWRKWRFGRLRGVRDFARLWLRHSLRLWVTLEAYFFLWYRYQKWRLSRVDIQRPPVRRKDGHGRAKRREYLERFLGVLAEACLPADHTVESPGGLGRGRGGRGTAGGLERLEPPRLGQMRRMQQLNGGGGDGTSRHPLLGRAASAASADALLRRVSSWNHGVLPSAEDLVRLDDSQAQLNVESEVLHLSLKRAELCSWFFFAPIQEITRGNLAEWIAEYFFRGMSVEAIGREPELAAELWELVEKTTRWAQLSPDLPKEPNPKIRCMRLTRDPLPCQHRPFWGYLLTMWVLPRITRYRLVAKGFRHYRAGAMAYWLRRGTGAAGSENARPTPFVFCHGLGVGMLPYVRFVSELCRARPEADVFCVDLPHIQMRPREDVPSARETCACIGDMLQAWGHTTANFVGHSFGTLVCAWAVRYMPETCRSVSFIDPVCFLLCKSDLIYNAVYSRRSPLTDLRTWLLTYLIFKELYVCHTLLRNFFWQQNNLWPDDLAKVPSLVIISGQDRLVPAHCIRRHLHAEVERRRLIREARRSGGDIVIQTGLSSVAGHDDAVGGCARGPWSADAAKRFVGAADAGAADAGAADADGELAAAASASNGAHCRSLLLWDRHISPGGSLPLPAGTSPLSSAAAAAAATGGSGGAEGAAATAAADGDELADLQVRFLPEAAHGQFWVDRALLDEVLTEIAVFA